MAGGHVWRGVCMVGAVCGGGHAWQGVVYGRGCAWQGMHAWLLGRGACVEGGMRGRKNYNSSGRYASYWNAFLFGKDFLRTTVPLVKLFSTSLSSDGFLAIFTFGMRVLDPLMRFKIQDGSHLLCGLLPDKDGFPRGCLFW